MHKAPSCSPFSQSCRQTAFILALLAAGPLPAMERSAPESGDQAEVCHRTYLLAQQNMERQVLLWGLMDVTTLLNEAGEALGAAQPVELGLERDLIASQVREAHAGKFLVYRASNHDVLATAAACAKRAMDTAEALHAQLSKGTRFQPRQVVATLAQAQAELIRGCQALDILIPAWEGAVAP